MKASVGVNSIYLGVDVAGKENTWIAALSPRNGGLEVVVQPHMASLKEILTYCEENNVVAVAIDAQLTVALSDESGFRTSDHKLRELLPPDCRNWVASINSLMAVPIRGRMLAEALSPIVGTLLETHPRACLLLGLGRSVSMAVRSYKRSNPSSEEHVVKLVQHWCNRFHITPSDEVPIQDGALDSLVCATVAYLYHHMPEKLLKLRHEAKDKTGRGPFFVVAPVSEIEVNGA